jgi:hypothetical protein
LSAVVNELLKLGSDLHKCPSAVRLVIRNTLLAIIHINFEGRSRNTESWSFSNCLSFQKTVIAPRVTCCRNRCLCLSSANRLSGSLEDGRGRCVCDDLGCNKYVIRETIISWVHVEIVIYHVKFQARIRHWRGVAINVGIPQLQHGKWSDGYAFVWRAIVAFGWQPNLEVTIFLLRLAQIAWWTTPSIVGW